MIKYLLSLMLLIASSLPAAFMTGDIIPDIAFKELKFNSDLTVDTLNRSLHSILDDGRTVIIYFFTITFS